jgi:hypothetical protein
MADPLWIEDGFTREHHVPAVEGLRPAADVVFRPALARERTPHAAALASNDPDRVEKVELDLMARYVLKINGEVMDALRSRLGRLHPSVRAEVVNVVLSYWPAKQRPPEEELRSFPGASG